MSRALGLSRFAIFGHSHHAYVALRYARKYPNKISHVIMTGCSPCDIRHSRRDEFWDADASAERKDFFGRKWGELQKQRARMPAEGQETANLIAMAPKLLWDLRENGAFVAAVKAVHNDRDVYFRYQLVILREYGVAKEGEGITAPIFLALGRYDYVAPYVLWEERRGALPKLACHLFSRSGHFPMFEEQELFDKKLVEWIGN